jgi:hypothetical protein
MTTKISRSILAAAVAAVSFSAANTAFAQPETFFGEKASTTTHAVPAFDVVSRGSGQTPTSVGEKQAVTAADRVAFQAVGPGSRHVVASVGEKQHHRQTGAVGGRQLATR